MADWGFRSEGGYQGPIRVESVESESGAAQAGLKPGDVIMAVNGRRLTIPPEQLSGAKPGQRVELQVERRSKKVTLKLQLGTSSETHYRIAENPQAPPDAVRLRNQWLEPESVQVSGSPDDLNGAAVESHGIE